MNKPETMPTTAAILPSQDTPSKHAASLSSQPSRHGSDVVDDSCPHIEMPVDCIPTIADQHSPRPTHGKLPATSTD